MKGDISVKLMEIMEIKGKIELITGLHIGAGDAEMQIGGTDNSVVKHPHTLEPFIPGSSLKGKVRSLLEMGSGLMQRTKGKPVHAGLLRQTLAVGQKEECIKILKIFGTSGADTAFAEELGPTRVSFADCSLTNECRESSRRERLSLTEVKSENSINRISGTAEHPRFTERVPAGMTFDFSIYLKILDEGEEDLFDYLLKGLKLLEMDTLGGNGSRGYGRIKFELEGPQLREKFEQCKPFASGGE
jgi:CRISPR-associated protein Csm3